MVSVPASLRSGELDALWERVRERLETSGLDNRGRLRLPDLSSRGRLALQSLIDRRPGAMVDLGVLEAALVRLGVGDDLPTALDALRHPVSGEPAARRAERAERRRAHSAARAACDSWPEPWAREWIDGVIRAGVLRGFDDDQARDLVGQVREVLDRLERGPAARTSRVDLAAQILGSSHALDTGSRLETAVTRALRLQLGADDARDLWEQAGVHLDLTSAPALTWGLPFTSECGLTALAVAATTRGIPLHLSRFALERHPADVVPGTTLLVVENPRIVEAAAQAHSSTPVISTNGQPSSTVLLLLTQLREAGAELYYHGDFDTPGLAICARMATLGLTPWHMSARDYRDALAAADSEGTPLPLDMLPPGSTPWDPTLRELFDRERRIVHEERLLPRLIEAPLALR